MKRILQGQAIKRQKFIALAATSLCFAVLLEEQPDRFLPTRFLPIFLGEIYNSDPIFRITDLW